MRYVSGHLEDSGSATSQTLRRTLRNLKHLLMSTCPRSGSDGTKTLHPTQGGGKEKGLRNADLGGDRLKAERQRRKDS